MQEVENKISVYIAPVLDDSPVLPFLTSEACFAATYKNRLFQNINFGSFNDYAAVTSNPEESDCILVPHDYSFFRDNKEYIRNLIDQNRCENKKVIIFYYSDNSGKVNIPNAIVIRSSCYLSDKENNEIIMPAYVEDLASLYPFQVRQKHDKPVVGFVGQADFKGFKHRFVYFIKNYFFLHGSRKDGLYFRRRLINVFKKSESVVARFKLRKFYSGHVKSIKGDVETIRQEYLENILESDFILAPKGDGNYSLRFYETLASGRIPILLDTEVVLPLEDMIDYNSFIFRLRLADMDRAPLMLRAYWDSISDEQFREMQIRAREAFSEHLYLPKFFKTIFSRSFMTKYIYNE